MSMPVLEYPATQRKTGGVWEYISPSRLNLWLRCPLAYKLRYIDGVRTPTTPALFLGKMVHHGLEIFYRHRQLGMELSLEDVATRLLNGWDDAAALESGVTDDPTVNTRVSAGCNRQSGFDAAAPRPFALGCVSQGRGANGRFGKLLSR